MIESPCFDPWDWQNLEHLENCSLMLTYMDILYIYRTSHSLWSLQMFSKDWNVPDKSPNITCRKTHVKIYRIRWWNWSATFPAHGFPVRCERVFLDVPGCSESFRFMWIRLFLFSFFSYGHTWQMSWWYMVVIFFTLQEWTSGPCCRALSTAFSWGRDNLERISKWFSISFLCGCPVPLV